MISVTSLPARGAWIEIAEYSVSNKFGSRSLPARGAWIEILFQLIGTFRTKSLPARGAWIEISYSAN